MAEKHCTKCFHSLPQGRRHWRPWWQKWAGADETSLHYAGEGPLTADQAEDIAYALLGAAQEARRLEGES